MSKPVIAITRPFERSQIAKEIVEDLGGEALIAPTLDLKLTNSDSLKKLISNKNKLDWIIFTSSTSIESIERFYPDFKNDLKAKIAVIGKKTAEVARKYDYIINLIPQDYTAEGLLESFKDIDITNNTIGIPRTFSARDTLPEGLENKGAKVILAEAYESLLPQDTVRIEVLIEKIKLNEIDGIIFTSPLTVENLFKVATNEKELADKLSVDILTVAIGPITSNTLNKYNVTNIYPDKYTVQDMLELLFQKLE
ncbi:uroporphyrinogen-III synthase [Methanobrevibacter sp. DSM 116169]|uniref:uroporphyrinogen-III synthase n=1 Tax=Methanobrevibacter sp. DSM 116169 TaxID=3242727 RepID=UPI0038FCDF8C